jgi:hypothetical protein
MADPRCPERDLVDRHFRGRISPEREQRLRQHLPDCESCRGRYERHLLNSRLAGGLDRADRLAIGLGLPRPSVGDRQWAASPWSMVAVAAAAGVALFALSTRGRGGAEVVTEEFTARGASPAAAAPATLEMFRVDAQGGQKPVRGFIDAADELAFAYGNPSGFRRLAVFAADETGAIYWFFPAWRDPKQDPVALAIEKGQHRELPEAIRHEYQGSRLRVVALFLNEAVSVKTIENNVRKGDSAFHGFLRGLGGQKVEQTVQIRR